MTALPLLLRFFRGYCPTCRPIPGVPMHKAACFLRSLEDWQ